MNALASALQAFVDEKKTPGAAALVLTRTTRISACAGVLHAEGDATAVDEDTVYDLASLTKLLSTTLLVSRAVDAGIIRLDEQPWPHWPGVTVEHALRHSTGLPAWLPLYEIASARAPVATRKCRAVASEAALLVAPEAPPGSRTLYSDIGFIALGALLEERLATPLEDAFAAAARETYDSASRGQAPAPQKSLRYVRIDRDGFHPAVPKVAATERCPWRKHVLIGQVHDENCFSMSGVSGHAGLFGSLRDVERAGAWLLDELTTRAATSTLARFAFAPLDGEGARPIGFDRVTPGGSTGDALGPRTVGHLGYTGTSLWIDPDLGALFVLLTNHVHYGRDKARIMEVRQRFHRAARALL